MFAFKSPPTTKKKHGEMRRWCFAVVFSFFVSCTGFHQSPSSFVCEIQGLGVFLSTRKPKKAHTFLYSRLGYPPYNFFVRSRAPAHAPPTLKKASSCDLFNRAAFSPRHLRLRLGVVRLRWPPRERRESVSIRRSAFFILRLG